MTFTPLSLQSRHVHIINFQWNVRPWTLPLDYSMCKAFPSMSSFNNPSQRTFRMLINRSHLLISVCVVELLVDSLHHVDSIDLHVTSIDVFSYASIPIPSDWFCVSSRPISYCFCKSQSVHPSPCLSECLSFGCFPCASAWQTLLFRKFCG